MDLKKGITIHHHHLSLGVIAFILIIVVVLIMIKPALQGYQFKKQFEQLGADASEVLKGVELLKSSLLIAETNLENANALNQQYLKEVTQEKSSTFSCLEEKRKKQSEFDQLSSEYLFNLTKTASECSLSLTKIKSEYEQNKSITQIQLEELKIRFKDLNDAYNSTIQSAANNICCKGRVDNPDIDSYIVSNNKIICSDDSEKKISC